MSTQLYKRFLKSNAVKTIVCITIVVMFVAVGWGCASRNNVTVVDAMTRKPIAGAKVEPIYPSFNGPIYETNAKGVAHIGGYGVPRDGYGVEVTAPGYEKNIYETYTGSRNQPDGRSGNLVVELTPTAP